MRRTLFFMACLLTSITMQAQKNSNDYIPFVEKGKTWHVVRSNLESYHFDRFALMNEEVIKNGKTYFQMNRSEDNLTEIHEMGLLREENRKVYFIAPDTEEEHLIFDYSLKAGDTYETFSFDKQKTLTYKVLSVNDFAEGPQVTSYDDQETEDSIATRQRYLRRWIVCRTDNEDIRKTWIEGIGSIEEPLANLYDERPVSSSNCLAYVENQSNGLYLPFSFYDKLGLIHGSNLPTGKADLSDLRHHQLTYELDGDRLHVYGKVLTRGGLNNYAYFIEETTDDPLTRILHFEIQPIEPLPDPLPDSEGLSLHATNFYVPGFDPKLSYIVVDNQGEEHPVINMTPQNAYRPFVEDGKMWVVNCSSDADADETMEWTDYCYFDGDTIIGGRSCKKMKSVTDANESNWVNGVFTPGNLLQSYIGAFYEQGKKVYYARNGKQSFELLYDFTLSSNDTLDVTGFSLIVRKMSGGIMGYKGTYYEIWDWGQMKIRWFEGVGSDSWPYVNYPSLFAGASSSLHACIVGDEVIYNSSMDADPYLIKSTRQRFDFTHTIKTRPKAPKRAEAEQSLYGNYNDMQLDINLDPLDTAYMVHITNESGNVIYKKVINAGSIVALNIDISTYAKGLYTVTIENSQELYTGVFESQPSGIANHFTHDTIKDGSIFNLQGQRISSLRKGLNIVNGKKYVVK